jgi:hypothetical protein
LEVKCVLGSSRGFGSICSSSAVAADITKTGIHVKRECTATKLGATMLGVFSVIRAFKVTFLSASSAMVLVVVVFFDFYFLRFSCL